MRYENCSNLIGKPLPPSPHRAAAFRGFPLWSEQVMALLILAFRSTIKRIRLEGYGSAEPVI